MMLMLSVVLDGRGSRHWRGCGKLWVASLSRHVWGGEVVVWRSFPEVLFPTGRDRLSELELPVKTVKFGGAAGRAKEQGRRMLYRLARERELAEGWVVLADADCVVLRNPDHLMDGLNEVLVLKHERRCDPGFFAVRAECLVPFLDAVEELGLDGAVASGKWSVGEFERGEVVRAGERGLSIEDLLGAAVVHLGGLELELKLKLGFALHMMAVYGDKDGLFLDMLEA